MISLTPLETVPDFTEAIRKQLTNYWITSVEEFVSTARASNYQYGNGLGALAQILNLSQDDVRVLVQTAQAILPTDLTFDVIADQALGTGAIFEGLEILSATPFDLSLEELPAEKSLAVNMPPPRSQGQRNTCVAFTLVAMVQQMSDTPVDLSPQFAYWTFKERDGIPGDVGTRPDIAMQALVEMGVCHEQTWAYNPTPNHHNPGQGPPPGKAVAEAQIRRATDIIALLPNDILRIKATIAAGMSVLIGLPVQEHWTSTWQAWTLGRIRPPLPGEMRRGGHAMLAVGYKDDTSVPGNGYFIVRNSWGTTWGKENPDGAGYAHIPFQVVFQGNRAAFAIRDITATPTPSIATDLAITEASEAHIMTASMTTTQDLHALYQEAQQLVNITLQDLAKLNELMFRIGVSIQQLGFVAPTSLRHDPMPVEPSRSEERQTSNFAPQAPLRPHGLTGPLVIIGGDTNAHQTIAILNHL